MHTHTHKKRRSGIVVYMRWIDGKYCVNNLENEEIWLNYINKLNRGDIRPAQIKAVTAEKAPRIEMWELRRNDVKEPETTKLLWRGISFLWI